MSNANHFNGAAAERSVAAFFLGAGYEVWWPSVAQNRADFGITNEDTHFKTIQVKSARWESRGDNEYLRVRLKKPSRGSREYVAGDFDYLAATDGDRIWIIPFDALPSRASLCLDKRGPTVRDWNDYDPDDWRVK